MLQCFVHGLRGVDGELLLYWLDASWNLMGEIVFSV